MPKQSQSAPHVVGAIFLLFPHCCCGNYQIQSPIAIQASKALIRQSSGENHKRTRQGVSAKLESYIYKVHMVRATNNYACPYVHATISCLPHFLLKATILYTCALTLSFQILPPCSRPMTSHHVTCHVTAVSCTSSSSKRKIK